MTEAEALDLAAKAAEFDDWFAAKNSGWWMVSIHAHAKTLMENAALKAEVERLREALVMSIADMMRASGRLDVIAGCNEDRRIANALKGTCDFARTALKRIGND